MSSDQLERQVTLQQRAYVLLEWLVSDSCHRLTGGEFLAALGELLANAGIPIQHLAIHIRALDPTLFGRSIIWKKGEPIASLDLLHEQEHLRLVQEGPLGFVTKRGQWLAVHPDDGRWSAVEMLPFTGMAEVWLAPLICGQGKSEANAVSFGTCRSEGFHQDHLALFDQILPAIRNAVELKVWPHMTAALLGTYLGADPEKRVLSGRIRRGDVETIEAAIMFCDLCGFTGLSNRLSNERIIELLNRYFDQVVPAVTEHGGEILKFMGDGLLAIFRPRGNTAESCAAALESAQAICRKLDAVETDLEMRAGIGLHLGEVSYGNIGSGQRLDFTVIGRDVNLASRIQRISGSVAAPVVLSERFASIVAAKCASLGRHEMKGFEQPIELFAPI